MDRVKGAALPDVGALRRERNRIRSKKRFTAAVRSTVCALLTAAAASVLIATFWLIVCRTQGSSMTPTLREGELVVAVKGARLQRGDLAAFYVNNKLLIKRVIAGPGDQVMVDEDGTVYVNGARLDEPYVAEAAGNADIAFPCEVPASAWFVMGDHRAVSLDSRHAAVGCVYGEQIVGKVIFRIWPLRSFGGIRG